MSKIKGVKQAISNLTKISKEVTGKISKDTMFDLGSKVLELSMAEVPLDEGTLLRSASVQEVGSKTYAGYNMEYAARLHYHPEYRFQNGRKAFYLTDPIKNNSSNLIAFAQQQFIKRLNKVL